MSSKQRNISPATQATACNMGQLLASLFFPGQLGGPKINLKLFWIANRCVYLKIFFFLILRLLSCISLVIIDKQLKQFDMGRMKKCYFKIYFIIRSSNLFGKL